MSHSFSLPVWPYEVLTKLSDITVRAFFSDTKSYSRLRHGIYILHHVYIEMEVESMLECRGCCISSCACYIF